VARNIERQRIGSVRMKDGPSYEHWFLGFPIPTGNGERVDKKLTFRTLAPRSPNYV